MTRENEELTSITDQAAQWWVAFRHGEASASEKREFVEWVTRAPERVEASLRIARVHAAVSRRDLRWPDVSAEELIREAKVAPAETVLPLRPHVISQPQQKRRPVAVFAFALAASLIIAVCAGWFLRTQPEQFQTRVGEQRSVLLADGSRVTLNTASRIQVRMRADRRVIDLVRGEALFAVAHDENRPFDVRAGRVTARAVGTQFNVDLRAAGTKVTVVEGRVEVSGVRGGHEPLPVLEAADRVVVDSAGNAVLEQDINLSEVLAWTQQQLVFRQRPLGEVAEEFNRYNVGRIQIRSAALRAQEVTGTFRSDDVASFVAVLGGLPGVRVVPDGAGGYLVTSDGASSSTPPASTPAPPPDGTAEPPK